MLREFIYLILMQLKTIRTYIVGFIFFSLLFPLGFILAFKSYVPSIYLISGTLTAYFFVSTFNSVARMIARENELGRYALIFTAGVSVGLYSLSIAVAQVISDLVPILTILALGLIYFHLQIKSVPLLLIALGSSVLLSSSFGSALALAVKNSYQAGQYSNVLSLALTFFAPVYYPLTFIPLPFRYLTLIEPSTYVSQAIYYSLEGKIEALLWIAGEVLFSLVFLFGGNLLKRLKNPR